ncbi:MAG: hypothetical protein QOI31_283 [Solirubrobacterales bacterium]|nr:hypothetical protein [Solirubrobacterales bacterium]
MTERAEFNAEEWDTVRRGPATAALMVIASQRGGTVRESFAVGKVYTQAAQTGSGDILAEIVSDPPKIDREHLGTPDELPVRGPQAISEAVSLLESRAMPEEVDAFKRFCMDVAEHAAEATKSGDFLGIGGKRISEKESAALDQIASTLGIERSSESTASADDGEG